MKRVTHRDISRAVDRLNARRGLTYGNKGYLQYADITGAGAGFRPSFYATIADGKASGVTNVASLYRGRTMRETLANLERAAK